MYITSTQQPHRNNLNMFIPEFIFLVLAWGSGISMINAYAHHTDTFHSTASGVKHKVSEAVRERSENSFDCPQEAAQCPTSFVGTPPLILISLDGFHPDYLNRPYTPFIKKIAECGTKARFMYSVYPTKTFPNHYSQVTGLNPASHGIIDNTIYDPDTKKTFRMGNKESLKPHWWEKEPLWVTAEKQGKISATYFWPGSEVIINGTRPTYYKNYTKKATYEERVDQVLKWLDLPKVSRPSFITLYASEPDDAAHIYGTQASETNAALAKVDQMMERLFSGLQKRKLINCVNIVIVSDHGMSDINCEKVIAIQDLADVSNSFTALGTFGQIRPLGKENTTHIEQLVSKMQCISPNLRVYRKKQLPVRFHFADNKRISPIILDVDEGWTLAKKKSNSDKGMCSGGAHGYDNMFPEMRAIFIAYGPSFKKNYTSRPFINTELYEMLAELLNVKPNPNNGTRGSLHHILVSARTLSPQIEPDPPALGLVPKDDLEYSFRIDASNCSCSKNRKGRQMQQENVSEVRRLHLPFGVPYLEEDNATLRLLYNEDYVSVFDLKYRIPMWSAFTIRNPVNITKLDDICWKADARIPINDAANCEDYHKSAKHNFILQRPLYHQGFSDLNNDQTSYITNSIPMSLNYTRILETPINKILANNAVVTGELNVVTGPAFDLHGTGIRPPTEELKSLHERGKSLAPSTHIFIIATWCNNKTHSLRNCPPSRLDAHAFLLPNQPFTSNCESAEKVILNNVARVVDIEKLTGISFYTSLPIYDAIRLRTKMPERLS